MTAAYGPSTVKRPRRTKAQLEELDAAIIAAVQDERPVTVRGVFYRVVSAGGVEKTELGYRAVQRRLLKLRRDEVIPYGWITDGLRYHLKPDTWSDVDAMLDAAASSYRRALWFDQPAEVLIYSEKDAITGVVSPITSKWDVPLGIGRGCLSETFAYEIGEHVRAARKPVFIYQLGDHDPSGVDAWRVIQERVRGFAPDAEVYFERLAVTPQQITDLRLPTRPTKTTDSRAKNFEGESVEVDAIPPSVLRSVVENAIRRHIDPEAYSLTMMAEESEREGLLRLTGGGARE